MNDMNSTRDKVAARLPGWRAAVLFGLILLCLLGLVIRAVYLQGIHDEFLQEKGNQRYSRVIEVSAHRGMMTDRNGEPLAVSTPVESVWASPADIQMGDPKNARIDANQLNRLSQALAMPVNEVRERLADVSRDFVYLKRQLPPEQAGGVTRLNLPGVSLQREYRRYY
ncbi:MAG: penicillin-binding protein 2, partial [Gallionella sp.]|nr:penicillin-binding protein 2 [Gallionella sp.]